MNKNINLTEILKDCSKGWKFWSPMLGDVELYDIDQEAKNIKVLTKGGISWNINNDGTITISGDTSPEIMLYPSREQRDWSKFKCEYNNKLPKTWEEFCDNYSHKKGEYYISLNCQINNIKYNFYRDKDLNKDILLSKQEMKAHLALIQLHQLRDCYRQGWLPDTSKKYVIGRYYDPNTNLIKLGIVMYYNTFKFLSFQTEELAQEFLNNFRELIEKAGDLI